MTIRSHKLALGVLLVASAWFSNAQATPIAWSISGPATVSATEVNPTTWDLSYNTYGYGVTRVYTVSGVAADAGDYTFDWNFSGFHSWYLAQASLSASDASGTTTLLPNSGVSGGFNVSGTHTFDSVAAGELLNFTITGYNFDSSAIIAGTLHLEQVGDVPEPASFALLGLGLAGLGLSRRRKA